MSEQDDHDWLALLAGQPVPDAEAGTVREAQALRAAILAEHGEQEAVASTGQAMDRLLFRLKREGLLTPATQTWWQRRGTWPLVASFCAMALLLPWLLQQENSPVPRAPSPAPIRREFRLPQVLYVAKPMAQAQALTEALAALDVAVEHRDRGESQFVLAQIPLPASAEILDVLRQYRVILPPDGQLQVEIVQAGG